MASSLLLLLDDVSAVTKVAAAWLMKFLSVAGGFVELALNLMRRMRPPDATRPNP